MPTDEPPKMPHFWWKEEQARLLALKRQLERDGSRNEGKDTRSDQSESSKPDSEYKK
jgi:hypothetical protein